MSDYAEERIGVVERSLRSLLRQSIILCAICAVPATSAVIIISTADGSGTAIALGVVLILVAIASLPHAIESIVFTKKARALLRSIRPDHDAGEGTTH